MIPMSFVSPRGSSARDLYTADQPEFEFGTNTGMQGRFNAQDPVQKNMALHRLAELMASYGDKLDMQYTGDTGLGKNDAQGYSDMLNARTEATNITNILGGQKPLNTQYGGEWDFAAPSLDPNPAIARLRATSPLNAQPLTRLKGY